MMKNILKRGGHLGKMSQCQRATFNKMMLLNQQARMIQTAAFAPGF